jgi:hypothetical protein
MQRCSESIASLATALAKAQAELVNPEKSLVGTIAADRSGGTERLFRYAPLSSGLDIVRKTLGQHEIATVQTTTLDHSAGIVQLTTVLAHSSGEWIASDWPVCAIAETATPHRMGAALTYARRYALFTLVGIAGEDDLDAPDLATPAQSAFGPEPATGDANGKLNGAQRPQMHHRAGPHRNSKSPEPMLDADASAALRDRLLAELDGLTGGDEAALWAQRHLGDKNRLTAKDAQRVETAFGAKLDMLVATAAAQQPLPSPGLEPSGEPHAQTRPNSANTTEQDPLPSVQPGPRAAAPESRVAHQSQTTRVPSHTEPHERKARACAKTIDKSVLALPEPRRVRDREHVKAVAQQPCLICGRRPSDAHHLRFAQSRALGRKVSDEFTVPLCRSHHREVHRCGDEAKWWRNLGVDPTVTARALWLQSHPLPIDRGTPRNADDDVALEAATTVAGVGPTALTKAKPGRRPAPGQPNYETKPILPAGPR